MKSNHGKKEREKKNEVKKKQLKLPQRKSAIPPHANKPERGWHYKSVTIRKQKKKCAVTLRLRCRDGKGGSLDARKQPGSVGPFSRGEVNDGAPARKEPKR